jgi:hypothetical protein
MSICRRCGAHSKFEGIVVLLVPEDCKQITTLTKFSETKAATASLVTSPSGMEKLVFPDNMLLSPEVLVQIVRF